jgi:uncharacterized membrane protein YfcA
MEFLIGFLIAAAIGLTGVGAGVLTVPVLVLFLGVPAAPAVGTALVFSSVVKLLAAPVYIARKQVHWRTLGLLVLGGLPGVVIGSLLLRQFNVKQHESLLYTLLGITIVSMSVLNFYKMVRNPQRRQVHERSGWLPFAALPIAAEVGFSSAGAGALGSMVLLSWTSLTSAQVIGSDMIFGLVVSGIGGGS